MGARGWASTGWRECVCTVLHVERGVDQLVALHLAWRGLDLGLGLGFGLGLGLGVTPHLGGACGRAREAASGQVGPSDNGVWLRLERLAIIPLGGRQVAPCIRGVAALSADLPSLARPRASGILAWLGLRLRLGSGLGIGLGLG